MNDEVSKAQGDYMSDTKNEQQDKSKSWWQRQKETISELLPIYKEAIKNDKKRFIISNVANLGVAALWGGLMPSVSAWSLNALQSAVGQGAYTLAAACGLGLQRLLSSLDGVLSVYQGTNQDAFNFVGKQRRGITKTKKAGEMPEAARGGKNATEIAQVAMQSAGYEMQLLNQTVNLAFYIPSALLGIGHVLIRNPIMGSVVAASVGINSYLSYKNAVQNNKDNNDFRKVNNKFSSRQRDVLEHQQRVKDLGIEEGEYQALHNLSEDATKAMESRNRRYRRNYFMKMLVDSVTTIGVGLWAGIEAVKTGNLGLFAALTSATGVATWSAQRVYSIAANMVETLDKRKNSEKDLSYDRSHELTYGDKTPSKVQGHFSVKGLSYTYPGEDKPCLSNINLDIGNGLTVITGPSGGGKTTLLKMLEHRREGTGSVVLDGISVSDLPKGFLEQHMAIVNQQADYFEQRDISENLGAVRGDAVDASKKDALQRVGLYQEIGKAGLTKKMSELSGGQRQRENLAEALLRNSPILIYDEPTANLDQENRRKNWHNLVKLSKNHTVIVVTHNAQEIMSADRVITIENGRVVQDGIPSVLGLQKGYVRDILRKSRQSLRLSKEEEGERDLLQLKQAALMGLKSKRIRDISTRYKRVLGARLAKQLLTAKPGELDQETQQIIMERIQAHQKAKR